MNVDVVTNAMGVMRNGAWNPWRIDVGSMCYFCEKLEIKKAVPQASALTELCGIKVVENRYLPHNRAALIDKTGKVIRIFDV